MTGSNLPPGVNVSDIPGNRPEDEAEERFWAELETQLRERHNLDVEDEYWNADWFVTAVQVARDLGYILGTNDERIAHDLAAAEAEERLWNNPDRAEGAL